MDKVPDVHSTLPAHSYGIETGVSGLLYNVRLKPGKNCYPLTINVSAYVALPRTQRGTHISRFIEAIDSVLNENECSEVYDSLERIVSRVLERHTYSDQAAVAISGSVYSHEKALDYWFKVEYRHRMGGGGRWTIRTRITGITSCPSARAVYRYFEEDECNVTHMQRAHAYVIARTSTRPNVSPEEIAIMSAEAFSATPRRKLKRVEEYELVKRASNNTKFTEDVARELTYVLAKYLGERLGKGAKVSIIVKSMESIHPFDIIAKSSIRVGSF